MSSLFAGPLRHESNAVLQIRSIFKLSLSDEKARLNNFATRLQGTNPEAKGYIIVYTGPGARSGEATMRAERAKAYLVKVRGIDAGRVVAIDGGCRAQLQVELYLVTSSKYR